MIKAKIFLVVVLTAILLAAGAWFLMDPPVAPAARPLYATVLPDGHPLPAFSLTDQNGRSFTRDDLRGHTSLLFFGFTHCPDICPTTLTLLASVHRQIAAAPAAGGEPGVPPDIVFISVDPERDTPARLATYLAHFGDGITGLTGSVDDIRALAQALGIFFQKNGTGDHYMVDHTTVVLVVDPDAELQALFSTPFRIDAFVHDLPLLRRDMRRDMAAPMSDAG